MDDSHELPLVSESLVNNGKLITGCFSGIPTHANLLQYERGPRFSSDKLNQIIKNISCLEWRSFLFGDKRFVIYVSLNSTKVFGLASFFAWDKSQNIIYSAKRLLPFRDFDISDSLDRDYNAYSDRKMAIRFRYNISNNEIALEASAEKGRRPGFKCSIKFAINSRQTYPISTCFLMKHNRPIYSSKALMPMSGFIETKNYKYDFADNDAMGIFEDCKGYFSKFIKYSRVIGFGLDGKNRRIGFNFVYNPLYNQNPENENFLWINSRVYSLPAVKITTPNGPNKLWHIQDLEGLVDLAFVPDLEQKSPYNFIFAFGKYYEPFGHFEGILKSADKSEKVDVKGIQGLGEKQLT